MMQKDNLKYNLSIVQFSLEVSISCANTRASVDFSYRIRRWLRELLLRFRWTFESTSVPLSLRTNYLTDFNTFCTCKAKSDKCKKNGSLCLGTDRFFWEFPSLGYFGWDWKKKIECMREGQIDCFYRSFEIRPIPAGWFEIRLIWIGTRPDWRKNRGKKTWCDLIDPIRHRQKSSCNPLTFVFLLKRHRFDFKKKNWPGRTGQNSKLESWIGSDLKTMIFIITNDALYKIKKNRILFRWI
jgi:hypothetical protein